MNTINIPTELLEDLLEDACELRGEHHWRKDEPRCGYAKAYAELTQRIEQVETILANNESGELTCAQCGLLKHTGAPVEANL